MYSGKKKLNILIPPSPNPHSQPSDFGLTPSSPIVQPMDVDNLTPKDSPPPLHLDSFFIIILLVFFTSFFSLPSGTWFLPFIKLFTNLLSYEIYKILLKIIKYNKALLEIRRITSWGERVLGKIWFYNFRELLKNPCVMMSLLVKLHKVYVCLGVKSQTTDLLLF